MRYFQGLEFGFFDHLPQCSVWIDRDFPDFFALNYAHRGEIRWKVGPGNQETVTLTAPVAWWTWPGPRFQYGCSRDESWDHYFVTFSGTRAERFVAEELLPTQSDQPAYARIARPEEFRSEWESLLGSLRRRSEADAAVAVHRLEGMLLTLRQPPVPLIDSPYRVALEAIIEAIKRQPQREWDWEAEASTLGVSAVHFRRLFRSLTGCPPHQYRMQARLESAAFLLRTTQEPIKAIADAVGFPDPYHFSKQFRAYHKLPPNAYRKAAHALYRSASR